MMHSLKSKMRLTYGLILLCFVGFGVLAIDRLEQVRKESSDMAAVWVPRMRAAEDAGVVIREYRLTESIRVLSTSPDMAAHADRDLKENEELVQSRLAAYRKYLQKGESHVPLDKVQDLWRQYVAGNEQMLAFAKGGKVAEAADRLRNSANRFYLLADSLNEISESDQEHNTAASATATRIYEAARFQMIGTFGIMAFFLLACTAFFELRVWQILLHLSSTMKRLANNEFDVEVDWIARKDEVGEMARAVQIFKNNGIEMRRLEAEAAAQRKSAEEERRKNEEMLTALQEQQAFAVAAIGSGLEELAKGNLTCRLAGTFAPEFRKLQTDFNHMTDEVAALVGQVQKSGIQVSTSMTEIAATSKEQQATASEIAATTTQVGATSKEIFATSKELVKTMNEVSTVAEQTANLASSGQSGLSRMGETMAHVMEAATAINSKLIVLNEKAGNINQVVTTITKVADQTNLLSLNAAIEAEKAGEYGRGFGVVAAEIRRLADQTGVATYDIEQMVKEIQSAISAGVMGMDKFSEEVRHGMQEMQQIGEQLSQIILQVQTLPPRFETVNEGMQAQATGAEQISEALLQLTESAQQTVESLRQSTLAIDDLTQVSGGLRSSVSRFKLQA